MNRIQAKGRAQKQAMQNMNANFFGSHTLQSIRNQLANCFGGHVEDTIVGRRQAPKPTKRPSLHARAVDKAGENRQNVANFPGSRRPSCDLVSDSLSEPAKVDPVDRQIGTILPARATKIRAPRFLSLLSGLIPRLADRQHALRAQALQPSPRLGVSPRIVAINGALTPGDDFLQISEPAETGFKDRDANSQRRCDKEYLDL